MHNVLMRLLCMLFLSQRLNIVYGQLYKIPIGIDGSICHENPSIMLQYSPIGSKISKTLFTQRIFFFLNKRIHTTYFHIYIDFLYLVIFTVTTSSLSFLSHIFHQICSYIIHIGLTAGAAATTTIKTLFVIWKISCVLSRRICVPVQFIESNGKFRQSENHYKALIQQKALSTSFSEWKQQYYSI